MGDGGCFKVSFQEFNGIADVRDMSNDVEGTEVAANELLTGIWLSYGDPEPYKVTKNVCHTSTPLLKPKFRSNLQTEHASRPHSSTREMVLADGMLTEVSSP